MTDFFKQYLKHRKDIDSYNNAKNNLKDFNHYIPWCSKCCVRELGQVTNSTMQRIFIHVLYYISYICNQVNLQNTILN